MSSTERLRRARDLLVRTVPGEVRRVELREREQAGGPAGARGPREFWQDGFPELK